MYSPLYYRGSTGDPHSSIQFLPWPHSNHNKTPGQSHFFAPSSYFGATWEAALLSPESLIMGITNLSYPLGACVGHLFRHPNPTLGKGATLFLQRGHSIMTPGKLSSSHSGRLGPDESFLSIHWHSVCLLGTGRAQSPAPDSQSGLPHLTLGVWWREEKKTSSHRHETDTGPCGALSLPSAHQSS